MLRENFLLQALILTLTLAFFKPATSMKQPKYIYLIEESSAISRHRGCQIIRTNAAFSFNSNIKK